MSETEQEIMPNTLRQGLIEDVCAQYMRLFRGPIDDAAMRKQRECLRALTAWLAVPA